MRLGVLALGALLAMPAFGADPDDGSGKKGVHAVRSDDEVTVFGDLFARWDDTRWFIATEVILPAAALQVGGSETDPAHGNAWFLAN